MNMSPKDIQALVEAQLRGAAFHNCHGITPGNVDRFLVEPRQVLVDPDDLETGPRRMWIVLQERASAADGYSVVFDETNGSWGVAELAPNGDCVLVVSADSMAEALDAM